MPYQFTVIPGFTQTVGGGGTGPQGPPGPTGPAGADGADGADGAQGPAGPTGPAGADGSDGATGPQGLTGATGPTGAAGADGSDGAQGPEGPTGPTGPQGPQGPQGATGAAGSDGAAGADGSDGATGPQGPAGSTGPTGPTGPAGADGADGADGSDGATGPQGPAGQGVPAGGSTNQVLSKIDGTDYNTQWVAQSGGGSYSDSDVDTHLNTSSASSNEVLSWTGSDYDWVAQSGGGGGSSSLATAVYKGPSTAQSIASSTYSVANIATAVGTPNAIFSNSSGAVTLGAAGTYLVMCTVVLTGSTTNYRWTGELNIEQDTGSGFAEIGSVRGGYIRVNNNSNNTYITISRIVTTADTDDRIQFQIKRTSNTEGNGTFVVDNSTIQVIRLDGIPGTQGPAGSDGADGTDGTDGADGPSDIPQNSQTSAYTLVAGDNGKHINITTGGVTIPSGVFSAGNVVSIFNDSGSDQTITQGGSVTLRLAGTATTGNRVLAQYGLCSALCIANNEFVISGAGLS